MIQCGVCKRYRSNNEEMLAHIGVCDGIPYFLNKEIKNDC